MPSRTKAKKKTKKVLKKKKIVAIRKKKPVAVKKMKKEKPIGKVVHYYDRIGVAILELQSPLKVGDSVTLKRGEIEMLTQKITSMQIEHTQIQKAKKGDVIGVKVTKEIPEGAVVLPA